jgi:hypothetical protein
MFLQLSLLPHCRIKLCFLGLRLFLQHSLLFELLLEPRFLKLTGPLRPDFSFLPILISGSSLIGLYRSLGPKGIKFSLTI